MNDIRITYSKNTLPFIVKTHNGLVLNKYYAHAMSLDLLEIVLREVGFDNVPTSVLEDIRAYSDLPNQEKDVTVVFSYT